MVHDIITSVTQPIRSWYTEIDSFVWFGLHLILIKTYRRHIFLGMVIRTQAVPPSIVTATYNEICAPASWIGSLLRSVVFATAHAD